MKKLNIFRGIMYSTMAILLAYTGIQVLAVFGGSLELTAVNLYNTVGLKGILITAAVEIVALLTFIFAINNYKRYTNAECKHPIMKSLIRLLTVSLIIAAITYIFITVFNPVELVTIGSSKVIIYMFVISLFTALSFIFEFIEVILNIKNRKHNVKKHAKVKQVKTNTAKIEDVKIVNDVQNSPVFKFGKK
ncbi:MAG: hypothetical protein RR342_01170 [Bacilli bacterium]